MFPDFLLKIDLPKIYEQAYLWVLKIAPRFLFAVVAFIVGQWMIKLLNRWLVEAMDRRKLAPSLRPFLKSAVGIILQALLVIATIQILGVQITIFSALIGAFGVAAGLALSGTLQNFTSGIMILVLKPYEAGDAIIAQGQEGIVSSIQLFFTYLTTYDNKTVVIPNSKLSNEVIVNLSRQGKRRLDIELAFSYSFSVDQIKSVVAASVDEMKGLLKDPAMRIGVSALETDKFKLAINVWIPAHGFQDAKLMLLEKLIKDLKKAGVKLPGM